MGLRKPSAHRRPPLPRRALAWGVAALALAGLAPWAHAEVAAVEEPLRPAFRQVISRFSPPGYPAPTVPTGPRADDSAFHGAVLVGASTAEPFALLEGMPPFTLAATVGLSPRTAMQDKPFMVDGKKATLREKLAQLQPAALYLWLGVNGLDYKSEQSVLTDYDLLLDRLIADWPDIPVYLMALTPVKPLLAESKPGFTNRRVSRFNEGLLELAEKHNVYYLPIHPLLCNSREELSEAYGAGDGLHLRAAAYEVLADYLYTHVIPIEGE